ncbi:MAG: integrase [Deltaproteobacteria bacterium]|nr:MAG: integrase [Deltaproteobacteria bacterium]
MGTDRQGEVNGSVKSGENMAYKKTNYPGVRYREHPTRKHGVNPDRYFAIRHQKDGKRKDEGFGWASRGCSAAEAAEILYQLKKNQRTGQGPQNLQEWRELKRAKEEAKQMHKKTVEKDLFTFGELAKQYLQWAKDNKKSYSEDEQRYRTHLAGPLGDKPLKSITVLDLERLKRNLKKKLSPATQKHCLVLIRQMFNKAMLWGLYDGSNPIKGVKLPRVDNRRTRFLSHEEAHTLLEELKKRSLQVHDQALVSLYAGLRFGEIAALKWGDIDLDHRIIQVRDGKAGSRQAFMTDSVKTLFQARRPEKAWPGDLVFKSRKGVRQTHISHAFRRAVISLDLNEGKTDTRDKVVFHTLRHSFASWLAIQGTPLLTIKECLGHKTLAMTERYSHLAPDCKREAVNQLEAAIDKQNILKVITLKK